MKEAPESPDVSITKEGSVVTRTFNGSFTTLVANAPLRFQTMTGSPSTIFVDTVKVTKGKGGSGTMVVTLTPSPSAGPDDGTFPVTGVSTTEVEWMEVQRKLETHPRYVSGGAKALTDSDLDKIEEWKSAASASDRTAKYEDLSAHAKDFVDKLRRGTDTYLDFAPILRVTTPSRTKPLTGKCGKRFAPPFDLSVDGYEFLKTADRATKQGRVWTRVEEWTGALAWDHDLYLDA